MISYFIDDTPITGAYITALKSDNRDFLARFMLNGTELSCAIKRVEYATGSCGNVDQFSIGSIYGSSMTAEVLELTDDVKNKELELQIGLYVESISEWKWIRLGYFKISEVKKNKYGATLTGYGKIVANSSGTFIEPATKTLANIAAEIGNELGCTVSFNGNIDTSKVIEKSMYGLTTYQALQVLTSVIGGYACDNFRGNVDIAPYRDIVGVNVDTSLMTSLPEVEEQDFEITGIKCVVSEASEDSTGEITELGYTQGSPVNLIFNDEYMTESLFTTCANNLIGYKYRPGSINLSLGDPRLYGHDNLHVTDIDGSVYTVPCHQIRHIYDGGFRTEVVSAKATNIENNIGSVAPLQDFMKSTDQNFVRMKSEFDTLAKGVQYFWHDDEGAHVCTIPQDQYNNMYYLQTCVEVLITSDSIIFRQVKQGYSKVYTVYATYASNGITLGNYASMTSNGIILGDINNTYYQLVLNATQGLKLNGDQIVISDYSSDAITEKTTTPRICVGLLNGDSTSLKFTVPLECIVPEGTSVNISTLYANIKVSGTNYFLDYPYIDGGFWFSSNSSYTITGQVVGTSMTITITKNNTFKRSNSTSTAADAYSALVIELDRLTWTKPTSSRSANSLKSTKVEEVESDEEETR